MDYLSLDNISKDKGYEKDARSSHFEFHYDENKIEDPDS